MDDPILEPLDRSQAPTLAHLFQLYVHDFTELVPVPLGDDGRYDVPIDDAWWTAADHHPFLLRFEGALAGFALVRRGSRVTDDPAPMDVAEMFVVRGLRKRGVGRRVAHLLFRRFPGPWEVRVRLSNVPASRFWSSAIQAFAGRAVASERYALADGVEREVFRFGG